MRSQLNEEPFEMYDIRDMPDSWFDVIQREGNEFLEKTSIYPSELVIIIIQVIFQNFVYTSLNKENRSKFLMMVLETFMEQFKEWDEEAQDDDMSDGEE